MVTVDSRLDALENTVQRMQQQVSCNQVQLENCCEMPNDLVKRVQTIESRDVAALRDALARLQALEAEVSESVRYTTTEAAEVAGVPVIVLED